MLSRLSIVGALSLALLAARTSSADPGESREEIIARYGKPDSDRADTSWHLEQGDLKSEARTILYFSAKGAPEIVVLNEDGKSIEESYGWIKDFGQAHVMEILLRYSKGRPWRATKLDYPDTEMVWRYTQPDTNMHAAYTERASDEVGVVYRGLTVTP